MSVSREQFIALAQNSGMMDELKTLAFYYEKLKTAKTYQEYNKRWQTTHGGDQFPNADRDVAKFEKEIKKLLGMLYPATVAHG
jgi:hypothetical protein